MKPRKKWEPDYRFGGNPADVYRAPPLGTTTSWRATIKKPRKKK